jgi:hypothetical protein
VNTVAHEAEGFVRTPLFEGLARAGYVARGLIYAIIGVLAIRLAEGISAKPASQQGALQTLASQPFGHALLILMAIGLGGYAIWRLTQAVVGVTPEAGRHSTMDRIGALGSGIAYGTFCVLSISVLMHGSSAAAGSNQKPRDLTATAFTWPGGRLIVGIVGAVFLIVAIYQAYLGLSQRFLDDSKTFEMSPGVRKAFTWVGTFGLCARAVAFALIGIFIVQAARTYNAQETVGLDGALVRVTRQSYGPWLLGIVAVGLIAFGIYSIADAKFRKI